MLKKRIIPSILLARGRVLTSQEFSPWRTVGSLAQYVRLQVQRECDELFISSIDRDKDTFSSREMSIISANVNVPVTLIGNISSLEKAEYLLRHGADRVGLCSALYGGDFTLLENLITRLGRQSVVVDIPFVFCKEKKEYMVWNWKTKKSLHPLLPYLCRISSIKPGEIILSSVKNDGSMNGLDVKVPLMISSDIPLVLRGGAGSSDHFLNALELSNVSAVAASSVFSFSGVTPATMHKFLSSHNIPVRDTSPFPADF